MKRFIISLMILSLLMLSCGKKADKNGKVNGKKTVEDENYIDPSKPMSWGQEQVIYVFAEKKNWTDLEPYLKYSLERYYYTVKNEKLFEIRFGDVTKLDQYYKYKNLMFICDMSSDGPVSKYVKEMMSPVMTDHVNKYYSGLFAKHNLWANEQFVVFMIANNHDNLVKYTKQNLNELFYHYKKKMVSRSEQKLKKVKKVSYKEFRDYPFTLEIPASYLLYKRYPEKNFISYMWRSREDQRQNPDKYISVYYEKSDKNIVNKEWLEKNRKKIAWDYYEQDIMKKDDVQFARYRFIDRVTYYMSGRWQNEKYYIGGTFQAMAFYDEKTKTAYLIDTSVYFPFGDKLKYLIELESIAKTFKTK
jgi:hypothetical protein